MPRISYGWCEEDLGVMRETIKKKKSLWICQSFKELSSYSQSDGTTSGFGEE